MHSEQQIGLVLRSNNSINKGTSARVAVLDKVHGRFDALLDTQNRIVCNGALIRYRYTKMAGWTIPHLLDLEQIRVPWEWTAVGLEFVHHMLELCLCCIPIGSMANEVVDILVTAIYQLTPDGYTALLKKIIIVRILLSLGIVSDQITVYYAHMELFLTTPLEEITSIAPVIDEQQLQELIISCLQPYISFNQLRTMLTVMEL